LLAAGNCRSFSQAAADTSRTIGGSVTDGAQVASKARPIDRLSLLAVQLLLLSCCLCSGCATHRALRQHTVAANSTTADIYYQQVLNNVARFVVNPASMPSFSVISGGTVNIEDNRGAELAPTLSPTLTFAQQGGGALPILSILFGLNAKRAVTENWSTQPVTDADNLRRMRCAFQIVVDQETSECDRCRKRLEGFFVGGTESYECMLPRGWFEVGCEEQVPPDACFVACYADTYVWVMPEGLDGLTRFSITILDIATGEIHAPQRSVVKKYKGESKEENLVSTEVTTTETDTDALKSKSEFSVDRLRPSTPSENRGLFFVPR
jgi:hypothetical protein